MQSQQTLQEWGTQIFTNPSGKSSSQFKRLTPGDGTFVSFPNPQKRTMKECEAASSYKLLEDSLPKKKKKTLKHVHKKEKQIYQRGGEKLAGSLLVVRADWFSLGLNLHL